jgi:hypothetical protein
MVQQKSVFIREIEREGYYDIDNRGKRTGRLCSHSSSK